MKLNGMSFTNSATCRGVMFTSDTAPLDMAEITISGRYPESGWARNMECHEMVRVQSGKGVLLFRDGEIIELSAGDIVHVPPETWFAWNGNITLLMACSPVFDTAQYETEEVK